MDHKLKTEVSEIKKVSISFVGHKWTNRTSVGSIYCKQTATTTNIIRIKHFASVQLQHYILLVFIQGNKKLSKQKHWCRRWILMLWYLYSCSSVQVFLNSIISWNIDSTESNKQRKRKQSTVETCYWNWNETNIQSKN